MRKYKVTVLALIVVLLLVLYAIDWVFNDNLSNFLSFAVGIILLLLIFFWSVVQIVFYKNYKTIVILLLLSLFFILPLKRYYVLMDYYLNKEKRDKIIRLYRAGKLLKSNQKFFDGVDTYIFPKKYSSISKDERNIILGYKQCVLFPLFHYTQLLMYCNNPEDFLKKYHYKREYDIDDNYLWITEKTSSEM